VKAGRLITSFDLLWCAASAEQLGNELALIGLEVIAGRYYADAATLLAHYDEIDVHPAIVVLPTPAARRAPLVPSW
jgi:hypothetical protein